MITELEKEIKKTSSETKLAKSEKIEK